MSVGWEAEEETRTLSARVALAVSVVVCLAVAWLEALTAFFALAETFDALAA